MGGCTSPQSLTQTLNGCDWWVSYSNNVILKQYSGGSTSGSAPTATAGSQEAEKTKFRFISFQSHSFVTILTELPQLRLSHRNLLTFDNILPLPCSAMKMEAASCSKTLLKFHQIHGFTLHKTVSSSQHCEDRKITQENLQIWFHRLLHLATLSIHVVRQKCDALILYRP